MPKRQWKKNYKHTRPVIQENRQNIPVSELLFPQNNLGFEFNVMSNISVELGREAARDFRSRYIK